MTTEVTLHALVPTGLLRFTQSQEQKHSIGELIP